MGTKLQIVIDCAEPSELAAFWAEAIHYVVQPPPAGFSSWEDWLRAHGIPEDQWNSASAIVDPDGPGPRIYFQRVPEAKNSKNRLHLDLNQGAPGLSAGERRSLVEREAQRLTGLGARELYRMDQWGEFWVTMADPEGNEFCVQ